MTAKEMVRLDYPDSFRIQCAWGHEIITPSRSPSAGYKAHRCLGAGSTPGKAWSDAAQRLLRRGKRRRPVPQHDEQR